MVNIFAVTDFCVFAQNMSKMHQRNTKFTRKNNCTKINTVMKLDFLLPLIYLKI